MYNLDMLKGSYVMNEVKTLCENIRELRLKNNLSKRATCKALKISTHTLSMIEKGVLPPRMKCETLVRACHLFGITVKDIFENKD